MYSQITSAAIHGLDVIPIHVETDISDGLPCFAMVGYISAQIREAEDRIRTSFRNSSILLPPKRVTINLSPASVPKSGSLYDFPIALTIIAAMCQIPPGSLDDVCAVGELSLNGHVNAVNGVLPIAITAKKAGIHTLLVPMENAREGRSVGQLNVIGVSTLRDAVDYFRNGTIPFEANPERPIRTSDTAIPDFAEICGQDLAKRAATIAVAGFHNLLLVGPPGSGKTMIARCVPSILSALTDDEQLEIEQIYSISGLLDPVDPVMTHRPYRHPHHTISPQALAGGGKIPKPGEITLAHRGVLFLDEMPEFSKRSLEILRQPLEDRDIVISRASGSFRFPANFLLLAAMNPCPCGHYPDLSLCTCSKAEIQAYQNRISKPLMDRIDLFVDCPPLAYNELTEDLTPCKTSEEIRAEVEAVRLREKERFTDCPWHFNSEIPAGRIRDYCQLTPRADSILKRSYERYRLSARGYHRVLRVSRTIADLDHSDSIEAVHVEEALTYRQFYGNR